MFSNTVEYALRAIVYLAYEAPEACTTAAIATGTKIPKDYLAKILQGLAKKKIVTTQRGLHGGVSLAKPPAELTILDVVNAVEPIQRIQSCPLGLAAHGVRLCPLHRRMDAAMATVEKAFRETTLAEVLSEPSDSVPLCETMTPQALKLRRKT
jgi:Rrf2 family protein